MEKSTLYDSLFKEAEAKRNETFQDWLNTRKESLSQQRTEDVRMARINALGNLLYTMVQPIGWAVGGSTAEMQPYDNRQYLESFNRAVKASDDLRNLGNMEAEYKFKLADEDYQRARKLADDAQQRELAFNDFKRKEDYQTKLRSEYSKQQFEQEMKKIEARGKNQQSLESLKANYKVYSRSRVPVEEKMLSTAWTAYLRYKNGYEQDISRGVTPVDKLKSFEEWAGEELGWVLKSKTGLDGVPAVYSEYVENKPKASSGSKVPPSQRTQQTNSSKVPPSQRKQ